MTDDILSRARAYQEAKRTLESKVLVRDLAAEVERLRCRIAELEGAAK